MPTPAEVKKVVEIVVGNDGDETVLEYVVSILEDGEFEFGTDGEEAFEAFGAVLVGSCNSGSSFHCVVKRFVSQHHCISTGYAQHHLSDRTHVQVNGGHCSSDEEAKDACKQLAIKLGQDQAPAKSSFRVLAGQQPQWRNHQLNRCMFRDSCMCKCA